MTTKKPEQGFTLRTYLRVQERADKEMYFLLRRLASELDAMIASYAGQGFSGQLRADQLAQVKRQAQLMMIETLQNAGLKIEAAKIEAAMKAAEVGYVYDRLLLESAGFTKEMLETYRKSEVATARLGLEAARERLLGSSYVKLSDQVWNTTKLATGAIDRIIDQSLAAGLSARELAKVMKQFALPTAPGGLSYVTMRLARTEINNAFHATQVEKNRTKPWVDGMRWNLSESHPTEDECNAYATQVHDASLDAGVFPKGAVPRKPHPQCLCYMTSETVDDDTFLDNLLRGSYDRYLDGVMGSAGFSRDYITRSRLR